MRVIWVSMSIQFTTNAEIFENRSALTTVYTPSTIINRYEQIEEYVSQLTPAVNGNQPNNIFVYGKTGVGKTLCTQNVIRKATRAAEEGGTQFTTFTINCDGLSTDYQATIKIDSTIREQYFGVGKNETVNGVKPARNGIPLNESFDRLLSLIGEIGGVCLIIFDDVEKIQSNNFSDILYQLTRFGVETTNYDTRVGTILISSEPDYLSSLPPDIQSSFGGHNIKFSPYTTQDLVNILHHRIETAFVDTDIVDKEVVVECAKIAGNDGDARRALELLRSSGDVAVENGQSRVTIDCLNTAKDRVLENVVEVYINTLTEQQKVVVYATLIAVENPNTQPRTKEIHNIYTDLTNRADIKENGYRRTQQILNELADNDIVDRMEYNGGRGKHAGKYYTYTFEYPNDIISQIVSDTINMCGIHTSVSEYVE